MSVLIQGSPDEKLFLADHRHLVLNLDTALGNGARMPWTTTLPLLFLYVLMTSGYCEWQCAISSLLVSFHISDPLPFNVKFGCLS